MTNPLPAEDGGKSVESKIQKLKSRWNICYYLVSAGGELHVRKSLSCAKRLAADLQKIKSKSGKQNA